MLREDYWEQQIKPSYNKQNIQFPFTGENHYRFGQSLSQDVKDKISKTLTGRVQSDQERLNKSLAARKIKVYCYDYDTKTFITSFPGIRIMEREVKKSATWIRFCLNTDNPFNCIYQGISVKWIISSRYLDSTN